MAGLVPAIHALLGNRKKGVDARDKRGHDGGDWRMAGAKPHTTVWCRSRQIRSTSEGSRFHQFCAEKISMSMWPL